MTRLETSDAVGHDPLLVPPRREANTRRHLLPRCPVCGMNRAHFVFSFQGYRVVRCMECSMMYLNPQPSDAELAKIYSANYFIGSECDELRQRVSQMKGRTARRYLEQIHRYRGQIGGRLLEVGCGRGEFLVEAQRDGYDVAGVEYSKDAARQACHMLGREAVFNGELVDAPFEDRSFDVCVLCDVIEHVRSPLEFLRDVHRLLKPGGAIFIATPSLDSWSARLMRQSWMEFKPEHLTYFGTATIQNALYRTGFEQILVQPGWKVLNLSYIAHHFERFPAPIFTSLVRTLARFTPHRLRDRDLPIVASGMGVLATAGKGRLRHKVSVIVPAYNEAATLPTVMDALLHKELPECDVEVVIVESNSTDGTRELVRRYENEPRVRVVLEDRPRGKGHAVRTGLRHATGDFILIQDADLEYDLEDYDALLEPLLQGHVRVVLGSRHGGTAWKVRKFTSQRMLSASLNLGHWLFAALVNVMFRLRLKDPFTMFKVFRRDWLYGLTFQCNRFDFDYELLIKLVRKGYRPMEIPVNYRSRSFKEGKKVSMVRDPLTWLWTILRLRFTSIDPLREIERQRQLSSATLGDNATLTH